MLWHQLTDLSQTDLIKRISEQSETRAVLIFKHSPRCGISSMVLGRLENRWTDDPSVPCYFLDVLAHRDISNQLASDYNVRHESPQALLIKNGQCIYHASHSGITVADLLEKIDNT